MPELGAGLFTKIAQMLQTMELSATLFPKTLMEGSMILLHLSASIKSIECDKAVFPLFFVALKLFTQNNLSTNPFLVKLCWYLQGYL